MTDLPLSGTAALVTAGGTGIGFACARRLLRDGASVTICARREEVIADAAASLREEAPAGTEVRHVVCDVTQEDQVVAAVEVACGPTGGIDHCVASAGMGSLGPVHALSLDEFRAVVDTNLIGTFLTFKHAAAPMVSSDGGVLVAISSTASAQMHSLLGGYGASKAGIDMLVTHMADELGPHGVHAHAVRPGIVETEMMEFPMTARALVDDYIAQMPLGRVGQTDDIAALVRFLCGPESTWMTGCRIDIDGGMHIRRAASYEPLARAVFGDDVLEGMLTPGS